MHRNAQVTVAEVERQEASLGVGVYRAILADSGARVQLTRSTNSKMCQIEVFRHRSQSSDSIWTLVSTS